MSSRVPFGRRWLGALLALTLAPVVCRADAIDKELIKRAVPIMKYLQDHGYRNVGVLRFEVQKGGDNGPVSMMTGRLNSLMATRLENALILANAESAPVGITRGAGEAVAAIDRKASFHSTAGRQKLFEHKYPLAWGTQSVPVDAFLTGRVTLSPDYKSSTVIIKAFDRTSPKYAEVVRFRAPVDRTVLSDMDQPFAVARSLKKRGVEDVILEEAQESARKGDTAVKHGDVAGKVYLKAPLPDAGPVKSNLDQLLRFDVYYDDQPVTWIGPNQLPPPQPGQRVHFGVQAAERLGMVLRVNGINTTDTDRGEKQVEEYNMWVLEPGRSYKIRGYYNDNNEVYPFIAKDEKNVFLDELGADVNRHGKIQIDLFRVQGGPTNGQAAVPQVGDTEPRATSKGVSLRGVTTRAKTLTDLKGQIRTAVSRRVTRRGFIVGGTRQEANVEIDQFQGVHALHLTLEYFRADLGAANVLLPDAE